MPYMPGMGGGAGQGQGQNNERSDASGLLSGDAKPWSGSTDVGGGEAGSPLGALTGGPGLDGLGDGIGGLGELGAGNGVGALGAPGSGESLGAGGAGEGMPYMPGMGGGAGQGQGQNNERSDASGLLSGDSEPWSGLPEAGEEAGTLLGAAAGGPGLHGLGTDPFTALPAGEQLSEDPATAAALPDDGWSAAGAGAGAGAGEDGMPYMPGMGGGAGQGQGQNNERSDASGLLEGEGEPWEGAPAATGEAGSPQGAAAGAGGLELGAEAAVAEAVLLAEAAALAARQHQHRHDDPVAAVPPALAGEAVAWGEEPAAAEPPSGATALTQAEVDPAALAGEPVPAALAGGPGSGAGEEVAAWDVGGDTLVPLLWGLVGPDEERDVLSSGYATAEDGTWGAQAAVAPAGDAEEEQEEGPTWTTWRPDRTPAPGGLTAAAIAATGALSARSTDEVPEEDPEEETEEEPGEQPQRRSIADLLVQDGDTWGDIDSAAVL
ncbi:hypothetical protein P3T36_007422 [Kitasatospora sp. MAP12-15]